MRRPLREVIEQVEADMGRGDFEAVSSEKGIFDLMRRIDEEAETEERQGKVD